jgi:hypothetical protein
LAVALEASEIPSSSDLGARGRDTPPPIAA